MRPSVLNRSYALELDLENQCLWRGDDPVQLTRKAFAVLKTLIEQRDRVITKAEILRAAWPNARVEEGQVKQFVAQLRQLLQDDPDTPRFIETVHGRGYRFVGAIGVRAARGSVPLAPNASGAAPLPIPKSVDLVGRDRELAALCELFSEVSTGRRRTCLVCGEPGIGKTALVTHFVAHVAGTQPVWHLQAKCMRHYHAVEPFLAIGNALEDLLRTSAEVTLRERVQRCAPGWLQWLTPTRLGSDPIAPSAQARLGEHAIREFGQLIDALAEERTVVLCVDDVHWADEATLSLLSYLSSSERPARLLILATCPAQEALTDSDACLELAVQLRMHDRCLKLVVPPLSEQAVAQYLAMHWPQQQDLAGELHRETEGHPLFVARIVAQLKLEAEQASDYVPSKTARNGCLPIPDSVRELIEHEINRLDALDQELLETASVAGRIFSAAQLAPAIRMKVEEVERRCEALGRHKRLLRRSGIAHWPDGTVAARYEFLHHLAVRVLHDRVVPQRMRRLHRVLAGRLEAAYARYPDKVAAQLGEHFEAAGDFQRAARYLHLAGMNALKQRPCTHAVINFRKALALLEQVPASAERDRQQIDSQINLALALQLSRSLDDSDAQAAYTRARLLYDTQRGTAQNAAAASR